MSRRSVLFLASVLTLIGISIFIKNLPRQTDLPAPTAPSSSPTSPPPRDPTSSHRSSALPSPQTPTEPGSADIALTADDKSRIDEEITDAVTTYDPEGLPTLEHYLDHHDAEIRNLAATGLQRMGISEGAPILRAAAEKRITTHPEEAAEYLKIAAFLELPSARETIRKRFQQKDTSTPLPQPR